jgi:hypothetical protein
LLGKFSINLFLPNPLELRFSLSKTVINLSIVITAVLLKN